MAPPPCGRRRAPVLLTSAPPELGRSGGVWCVCMVLLNLVALEPNLHFHCQGEKGAPGY